MMQSGRGVARGGGNGGGAPTRVILGGPCPPRILKKNYASLSVRMKEKKRMGNFLVWDLMTPPPDVKM